MLWGLLPMSDGWSIFTDGESRRHRAGAALLADMLLLLLVTAPFFVLMTV